MSGRAVGAVVLSHGGGVPEAAMIGLPLLVLVVFVILERRARAREKDARPTPDDDESGFD